MTDTGDIRGYFVTVGQSDSRNFTKRRVRLLGSLGRNFSTNTTLLGLKENVIIGKLIPAGTGMQKYRSVQVCDTEATDPEDSIFG